MRTLTDAVLTALRTGLTVGDGSGAGLTPPFAVLYPLQQTRSGTLGGTSDDAWSDVEKMFQVTCEGKTREQAEGIADRADELMLASDLLVILLPRPDLIRDDTTGGPARWKAYPRYRVRDYAT